MKLAYVANVRMPSERAHSVQIAKTCEALAERDSLATLIVPSRSRKGGDPARYYGLRQLLPLQYAWAPDIVHLGKIGFLLASFCFTLSALRKIPHTATHLYGRDEAVLWLLSYLSPKPIIWESHTGSWNYAARALAQRAQRVVVISEGLKAFYVARGVPAGCILVAHDGVDLRDFETMPTKEEAQRALDLPHDRAIVMYVGGIGGWKGTETLLAAADELRDEALVVIVGGSEEEVTDLRVRYPHVHFLGSRPYKELPAMLAAADVLALPNTGRDIVSARYTSPLKLFAYMAAEKPIVASDLPSVREVLDDDSAYFVQADDPSALAEGMRTTFHNAEESSRKAARARERAGAYTWSARADTLLSEMGGRDTL